VVGLVVTGHVGYSVYLDFRSTRTLAAAQVERAKQPKLITGLKDAQEQTRLLADALVHDGKMQSGYDARSKTDLAAEIAAMQKKFAFPGNIQVCDEKGNLVFSTETPNQSGYSVSKDNFGVQVVLSQGKFFAGVTNSEKTGLVSISTIMPLKANGKGGVIAVNQPLSEDFLTGLANRFGIEDPQLNGVELAVYSNKTNQVAAFSQGVRKLQASKFLAELNDKGIKAVPKTPLGTGIDFLDKLIVPANGFESQNAWWNYLALNANGNNTVGIIFVFKPVPSEQGKIIETALLGGLVGVLGILVGTLFASRISQSVSEPLRFLVKRTQAIGNNRQVIPPLEELSGDWLELGELIDTAVLSMRSTTQSLKKELNKQMEEGKERYAQVEQSSQQVDALNRQITTQAQKITELSRQSAQATRQAIIVQQQLDAVLQSSTEGFLVLDQYGNILHANPVFLNWVGAAEGEIAGRLCFDLVRKPGDKPFADADQSQAFAQHGGNRMALIEQFYPEGNVYNRNTEKKVAVLAHLQPLTGDDGNIAGYIMVLRDKSLRSENQLLRQEIVSMLQQDIRQPLMAAEQSWNAILANAPNSMHPSIGQALAQLHIHYESLVGVIDSLLMMYGGMAPPPPTPKETIAITRLVADCLEEVTPLARERQLLLDYKTVTGLPTISGNREAIRGILSQVLERMINITQPGGRVRVESQMKGNEMRISVSSSGPSLPESEIAEMFAGFIEGKHAQETYSSRLSMYLARNNVERLGGNIWAESEAGRGTSTYFTIPIG
jgi:PAS domain S-box-containing protein